MYKHKKDLKIYTIYINIIFIINVFFGSALIAMKRTLYFCLDTINCDVDDGCDSEATCSDGGGSYTCTCNDGYNGDGFNCTGK